MEQLLDFRDFAHIESYSSAFCKVQDSYILCNITSDGSGRLDFDNKPTKFKGMLMMLARNGSPFNIEINRSVVNITPDTVTLISPATVVRFIDRLPNNLDMWLLYLDLSFLENINFNISAIPLPSSTNNHPKHIMHLDPDEASVMCKFLELINITTSTEHEDSQLGKCVSTSIIASMMYQMIRFYYKRVSDFTDYETIGSKSVRRVDYVREFIKLLRNNYTKERSVSFYADKLFISPKYLSLLVKETTGKSAAKWIDEFVIVEAKNMLRYSGKNIQQVAYALNFPTQSSFGKYFKHLTGMSPTEYQHS